jgi:predicted ester cyclase
MTNEETKATVLPFYTKALTVNRETSSTAVLQQLLADDFQSVDSHERKNKETLIKQVEFFWKLIPNLKWEPQDVVVSGDKVVVRSVASGSPNGNFMGLALDGTKSFRIDTIDIHDVVRGQIARVYHLEGWAAALKQLGGVKADHCIETATFRLKPGVTDEQLLALERRIRAGRIAGQPGYISRELAKDQNGTWLIIMRFADRAHLDAWLGELKGVPEMQEMGGMIEMASMKTDRFNRREP